MFFFVFFWPEFVLMQKKTLLFIYLFFCRTHLRLFQNQDNAKVKVVVMNDLLFKFLTY